MLWMTGERVKCAGAFFVKWRACMVVGRKSWVYTNKLPRTGVDLCVCVLVRLVVFDPQDRWSFGVGGSLLARSLVREGFLSHFGIEVGLSRRHRVTWSLQRSERTSYCTASFGAATPIADVLLIDALSYQSRARWHWR